MMKSEDHFYADTCRELERNLRHMMADVRATVNEGVVTLNGTVPGYTERLVAVHAVANMKGAKAVRKENLRKPGHTGRGSSAEISRTALNTLVRYVWTSKGATVNVESGWVTLRGDMDGWCEKDGVEKALEHLPGMAGTSDAVNAMPEAKPFDAGRKGGKALERNTPTDSCAVEINIDGGRVTLAGSVGSWAKRYEAARIAWLVPGIWEVTNNITVTR
jgi:osmotically-inducible protein OsmY